MSGTLTIKRTKVALPLTISDTGTVKDADGYYVTETVRPLFLASPDLLLAAEAVIAQCLDDVPSAEGSDMLLVHVGALTTVRAAIAKARGTA